MNTIEQAMARADAMRASWAGSAAVLTPRGAAAVKLIREGWLRDVAPDDREPAIYGLCISIPGIGPDDRHFLVDLVAAHQD